MNQELFALHPAEISFLLCDESFLRPDNPRDRASLESLREGGRQLLFGEMSLTARELIRLYGRETLRIFRAKNPGQFPSWWEMLTPEEQGQVNEPRPEKLQREGL